jgi:hypothetical protein
MCEVCQDPLLDEEHALRIPDAGRGHGADPCGYAVRSSRGFCGAPATWSVKFLLVAEHLCDNHRDPGPVEGRGSLERLLRSSSAQPGRAMLPCQGSEVCEADFGTGKGLECGEPARWVAVSSAVAPLCNRHLKADRLERQRERRRRPVRTTGKNG